MKLDELLANMLENNASDMHLAVGLPPVLRIDGKLVPLRMKFPDDPKKKNFDGDDWEELLSPSLSADAKNRFESITTVLTHHKSLFKCRIFRENGGWAASIRQVPSGVHNLHSLGASETIMQLTENRSGLLIICGPIGSGKDTLVAAMLEHINLNRSEYILALGCDNYILKSKMSLVSQRIVGQDITSMEQGLDLAQESDANIVSTNYIGSPNAIRRTLDLAASRLVLLTLNAESTEDAIPLLIEGAGEWGPHARRVLSHHLNAVIGQKLMPKAAGNGRVAANEILIGTPEVRKMIGAGQFDFTQILNENPELGTISMDDAVLRHYSRGTIDFETAKDNLIKPGRLWPKGPEDSSSAGI